jgi:hypothetical protein
MLTFAAFSETTKLDPKEKESRRVARAKVRTDKFNRQERPGRWGTKGAVIGGALGAAAIAPAWHYAAQHGAHIDGASAKGFGVLPMAGATIGALAGTGAAHAYNKTSGVVGKMKKKFSSKKVSEGRYVLGRWTTTPKPKSPGTPIDKTKELGSSTKKALDLINRAHGIKETVESELKPHHSPEEIAQHHGVSVKEIEAQLKMGIQVEHEHTKDDEIARDIALQHLYEKPDYYTKLKKVEVKEEKALFEMTYKEHAAKAKELRQNVKTLLDKSYKAINDHAAAERELKAHMAATPNKSQQKAAAKREAERQASWANYREPGRSGPEKTPYGEQTSSFGQFVEDGVGGAAVGATPTNSTAGIAPSIKDPPVSRSAQLKKRFAGMRSEAGMRKVVDTVNAV